MVQVTNINICHSILVKTVQQSEPQPKRASTKQFHPYQITEAVETPSVKTKRNADIKIIPNINSEVFVMDTKFMLAATVLLRLRSPARTRLLRVVRRSGASTYISTL